MAQPATLTPELFKRIRTYQKVLTAWSLLTDALNEVSDADASVLAKPYDEIRKWLNQEMDAFAGMFPDD